MKSKQITKAYDNKKFLHSPDGRILRILSEYLFPEQKLRKAKIRRTVIFFGSARFKPEDEIKSKIKKIQIKLNDSSNNEDKAKYTEELKILNQKLKLSEYYEDARILSRKLTEWSEKLPARDRIHISSGGGPGIMEAANRGSYEAGGKSIGLNISLPFEQSPNPYIHPDLNFEFHYFFMRKFWLVYISQIMVVFPGGFGTIDELMEILTLKQTKKMRSPKSIFLYSEEWWKKIINFDFMADMGVISREDLSLIKFVNSPEEAFKEITKDLQKNKIGHRF